MCYDGRIIYGFRPQSNHVVVRDRLDLKAGNSCAYPTSLRMPGLPPRRYIAVSWSWFTYFLWSATRPYFPSCTVYCITRTASMDHIPYTGSTRIGVQYLEGDDFDGGDFFGYPNRWNSRFSPRMEPGSTVTLILPGRHNFLSPDPVTLARCLQQWLFVGLYTTVLKIAGIEFVVEDFIDRTGRPTDDPRLCTKALPKYFQAFRCAVVDELTTTEQDSLENQLSSIFDHVTESFSLHCHHLYSQPRDDPQIADDIRYVAFPVTLSIEHCFSALLTVCRDIFRRLPGREPPKFGAMRCDTTDIDNEFNKSMIEVGWCPSVVSKMVTWSNHGDLRYAVYTHWREIILRDDREARIERFMQLFGMTSKPTNHSLCTEKVCNLLQVDQSGYEIRHLDCECYCSNVYPSPGVVESILQSGGIPVCRLVPRDAERGLEAWDLEVKQASPDRLYTAISHVSADYDSCPEAQLYWAL